MSDKNYNNRLAVLISLLLTGSITIGAGIIHLAQTGEVLTTIGGMLVGVNCFCKSFREYG